MVIVEEAGWHSYKGIVRSWSQPERDCKEEQRTGAVTIGAVESRKFSLFLIVGDIFACSNREG